MKSWATGRTAARRIDAEDARHRARRVLKLGDAHGNHAEEKSKIMRRLSKPSDARERSYCCAIYQALRAAEGRGEPRRAGGIKIKINA